MRPGSARMEPRLWRRWPGRMKKLSIRLATSATIATSGSATMIWPMMSRMKNSGRKATCVVNVAAKTGQNMRRAPISAASAGGSPAAKRVAVCSPTTIASSTMMPSIMIIANSDISPSVAMTAVGMPTATQKATRALRNRNRETTTRTSPCRPFQTSRFMRSCSRSARML